MLGMPTVSDGDVKQPVQEPPKKGMGWDWANSYREKPREFLDWYSNAMKTGYGWDTSPGGRQTPWGGKNEKETADIMAKDLLPQLNLHDIQEKYKDIYGQKDWYTSWLTPQLTRAAADEYRNGSYKSDALSNFKAKVFGDLAGTQKNASMALARRGLSSGGLAQGVQAKLAAEASRDLAQGKQDISNEAESLAQQLEANQMNSAIQMRNMQQQAYNTVYNSALQNYMQKKQSSKQLAGLAGMGAGFAIGGPAGAMIGGQVGGML